jgi:glucosamine-6-phosphate deaminase
VACTFVLEPSPVVTGGSAAAGSSDTGAPSVEVIPAAAWADHVPGMLADRLGARPGLVVCLPTGSTPTPLYDRLPAVLATRQVSAGGATVVVLDDYLGLPVGHPARCEAVLRRAVLERLTPAPAGFIAFDVDAPDPTAACAAFDAAVAAAGGLDLVVLGLGRNGHVGMNEPGSPADAPTRVVELAPSTREAARGYGIDPPPTHGVTLGMAGIAAAREIWLLATGEDKAAILGATLDGPMTAEVPASLLRDHPRLRVIVDDAAAADMGPRGAGPGGQSYGASRARRPVRTRSLDVGSRQVVLSLLELDDRTAEQELGGQRQVGGGGADLHADTPGLDDAAEVRADVGELLGGEVEDDGPALTGAEVHPPEAAQLADRAGDGRLLVADVELHHLVAGHGAGVRDVGPDGDDVAGRVEDGPVDAQAVDGEGRVRAAEPERPERRHRCVDVVLLRVGVAAGGMVPVRERQLADFARHGHG